MRWLPDDPELPIPRVGHSQYDSPSATAPENQPVPTHTPVPWRWTPCEMEDGEPISGAELRSGDQSVFTVDCGDFCGLSDANAAFIVRAVNSHDDMLAALKHAIAVDAEWRRKHHDPRRTPECHESYDMVLAAIAKAEAV